MLRPVRVIVQIIGILIVGGGVLPTTLPPTEAAFPVEKPPLAVSISGRILTVAGPVVGVQVALYAIDDPDIPVHTATTSLLTGMYIFNDIAAGQYVVRPQDGRYTFTPSMRMVEVAMEEVPNIDFLATEQGATFTAGGRIRNEEEMGIPGISVGLFVDNSDTPASTTQTDQKGQYAFSGLNPGTYRIRPANVGFTFVPSQHMFIISDSNVVNLNFVAGQGAQTYSLQGQVRQGFLLGVEGVTITLTTPESPKPHATTTTNGEGRYTFTDILSGTYRVTPFSQQYTFTPAFRDIMVTGNTQIGEFEATPINNPVLKLFLPSVRRR
jgi:hypothetical protein